MPIPDYETMMLPLLKSAGDEKEHSVQESVEHISELFDLTDEERRETLPSRRQETIISNRVRWASFYLRRAGLLESARRGHFKITARGIEVLESQPSKIDIKYLEQYPEFLSFKGLRKETQKSEVKELPVEKTPEELLEAGYRSIRRNLAQELLGQVKECSPGFFEKIVVELLLRMGYGGSGKDAGEAVGRTGDEGVDGMIKEDKLGLDAVYIQAKRWGGVVGRPEIHKFVGALQGKKARKGIFITTSSFTEDAAEYVSNIETRVVLIDGEKLTELMIDNDIGVSRLATYEIKKIDTDYFSEE